MTAPSLFGDSAGPQDAAPAPSDNRSPIELDTPMYAATSSLYRKHRPRSFAADELVGQEHVTRTLRNAIALDRVAHAYLFSGPRGTGKTTTARLLAKAINCLAADPADRPCNACINCQAINNGSSPDIIEIDAASNRGIDDIRDLRERVRYAPAQLRSKIYIIDEAHQITGAAANAFLKTLEEPPAHTRFILATTDPEELLPTIVSRCQRFEFRRVGLDDTVRRLATVAAAEAIAIDDDALRLIARHATGSLRDALGLLEQLALRAAGASGAVGSDVGRIDVAAVQAALGLSRNDRVEALATAIADRSAGDGLRVVQDAVDAGEDPRQLNRQLLAYLRQLLLVRSGASADADERARELAARFSLEEIAALARRFSAIDFSIKHAPYPQLPLEVALVEATARESSPEKAAAPARPASPAASQAPDPSPRPTSLRDRVRGQASASEVPSEQAPRPVPSEPAPITPLRASSESHRDAPRPTGAGDDVQQIVELWPKVRADVKALNRRIEALLSEVDPVAVAGNQITLAVPYPFHRDKLNTAEVRDTVSSVLTRLLGRETSLLCVLRSEITASEPAPVAMPAPTTAAGAPESTADPDEEERANARLRAAKNIFDAEEIQSLEELRFPASSDA
jgi:DNA polymerase-3 subunit gamma/tau